MLKISSSSMQYPEKLRAIVPNPGVTVSGDFQQGLSDALVWITGNRSPSPEGLLLAASMGKFLFSLNKQLFTRVVPGIEITAARVMSRLNGPVIQLAQVSAEQENPRLLNQSKSYFSMRIATQRPRTVIQRLLESVLIVECRENDPLFPEILSLSAAGLRVFCIDWPARKSCFDGNRLLIESGNAVPLPLGNWKTTFLSPPKPSREHRPAQQLRLNF